MTRNITRVTCLACLLTLITSASRADDKRPPILENVGLDQRLDQQVPLDLHFRDEIGADVALKQYFGDKPVILNLVYYQCPMLCTVVLNGLVSALRAMSLNVGSDFDVLTVSFDPRDTPALATEKKSATLNEYRRLGAENGWHFLTGDEDAIHRLTDAVGFRFAFDDNNGQFAHAAGIIVLTPGGRISRYFYGVEYAPRDLRLGLVEASQNRIGSIVDQILLFCFHYDPLSGRYSALTLNAVRVAGLLTVLALAGFIGVMLRKENKAARGWVRGTGQQGASADEPVTGQQPPVASPHS